MKLERQSSAVPGDRPWLNGKLGLSQEFNIQKLQQLDAEKAKIRKEYEKKESSGDAKKKM